MAKMEEFRSSFGLITALWEHNSALQMVSSSRKHRCDKILCHCVVQLVQPTKIQN